MKDTGIVRKLDHLGRIVLPMELRRTMNIKDDDPIEIYTDGDTICLKPVRETCCICRSTEELLKVDGILICREHAIAIANVAIKE